MLRDDFEGCARAAEHTGDVTQTDDEENEIGSDGQSGADGAWLHFITVHFL